MILYLIKREKVVTHFLYMQGCEGIGCIGWRYCVCVWGVGVGGNGVVYVWGRGVDVQVSYMHKIIDCKL